MSRDFIMDFETLGTEDKAVLLSIAVFACPEDNEFSKDDNFLNLMKFGIEYKIDRVAQIKVGRTMDQNTIDWWKKQGPEAQKVLSLSDTVDVFEVYKQIKNFMESWGYDKKESYVWSRGMIDQRWWQSFVKSLNTIKKLEVYEDFIPFWQWRDTRTACHLLCGNPNGNVNIPSEFIKHNSIHDCAMDYLRLSNLMNY